MFWEFGLKPRFEFRGFLFSAALRPLQNTIPDYLERKGCSDSYPSLYRLFLKY